MHNYVAFYDQTFFSKIYFCSVVGPYNNAVDFLQIFILTVINEVFSRNMISLSAELFQ